MNSEKKSMNKQLCKRLITTWPSWISHWSFIYLFNNILKTCGEFRNMYIEILKENLIQLPSVLIFVKRYIPRRIKAGNPLVLNNMELRSKTAFIGRVTISNMRKNIFHLNSTLILSIEVWNWVIALQQLRHIYKRTIDFDRNL